MSDPGFGTDLTGDLFVDDDRQHPASEIDDATTYARLQRDYDALHDKLENYVWENSNSMNRLRQSARRLERETAKRLRLEEELRLTSKLEAIGQLAAGVAHEINTPVQYVRDNTVFVAEGFGELRSFLDDVMAAAEAVEAGTSSTPATLQHRRKAESSANGSV